MVNDLKPVAQPLNHRAGIEQTAFQAVGGGSKGIGPAEGAEQTGLGTTHRGTGVDHEEGSGAVSALRFSRLQAELPEGCGLLIPQQCLNRCACKGQTSRDGAEMAAAGEQFRQGRLGKTSLCAEFIHPAALLQIHEQRAAGIAHVTAVTSSFGEIPKQPRFDGPETEVISGGRRCRFRLMVEHPMDLAGAEVRVQQKSAAVAPAFAQR